MRPVHGRVTQCQCRQNGQKESHGKLSKVGGAPCLSEVDQNQLLEGRLAFVKRPESWDKAYCFFECGSPSGENRREVPPVKKRWVERHFSTPLPPPNVIQRSISFQTGLVRECWRGKEFTGDKVSPWTFVNTPHSLLLSGTPGFYSFTLEGTLPRG